MDNEIINWIQQWYKNQCNGDWEHSYGIKIESLDNPGWSITIDLEETALESYEFDSGLIETNDDNWYHFKFKNSKYEAFGDITKLDFLLKKFQEAFSKFSTAK